MKDYRRELSIEFDALLTELQSITADYGRIVEEQRLILSELQSPESIDQ